MVDDNIILVTRPSTKSEILVDTLEDEEEVIEDYVHEIEEEEVSPKRWPTVLYSHGIARHHSVITTRCSTLMDPRIFVSCLSICGLSFVQIKRKVPLLTQKLASQFES